MKTILDETQEDCWRFEGDGVGDFEIICDAASINVVQVYYHIMRHVDK